MGKKNKNRDEFDFYGRKKDLLEKEKHIQREIAELRVPCSHTNRKGKLKVNFADSGTKVVCKKCGAKFDFAIISKNDLDRAIVTIHNALNQIKAFSNDPVAEEKIIKRLGRMDRDLAEIRELYQRAVNQYGQHSDDKKKKKKNHDNFGGSGIDKLLMGGQRR